MILKNLIRRKGRTLLAVLGISIGVAAIIGLGALTDGLQAGYGAVLTGSKADLVLKDADALDLAVSSIAEDIGPRLLAMPGVSAVSGLVQAESSLYFFVFGYPQGSFALERFQIVEGVPLVTLIQSVALHDDSIRMIWTVENVIRALIVALLLALVGGFYPALRATRLQPVEALRYE